MKALNSAKRVKKWYIHTTGNLFPVHMFLKTMATLETSKVGNAGED